MSFEYKARYRISEAARLCGLHVNTLRRLADEQRVPCQRDYNGHRVFSSKAIEQLRQMSGIPDKGFAKANGRKK